MACEGERVTTGRARWIYIAGQGRSGSTLLGMLAARAAGGFHCGELYRLPEALVAGHLCQCGAEVPRCAVWATVARRVRALTGLPSDRACLEVMRDRLRRRHLLAPVMPPARAGELALRRATERAIEDVTGSAVVVDSSKLASQLWTAAHLCRQLTVVHLVRDPRGVAFSQSRPLYDPAWRAEWAPRPPWQTALAWVRGQVTTERVVRQLRARAIISADVTLRYEDLVSDPASALERVTGTSLGDLAPTPAAVHEQHAIYGNPMRFDPGAIVPDERWRRAMGVAARSVVTAITAPLLGRYGYPLAPGRPVQRAAEPTAGT